MFGRATYGHNNSNPFNENRGQDLAQPFNQQNTIYTGWSETYLATHYQKTIE